MQTQHCPAEPSCWTMPIRIRPSFPQSVSPIRKLPKASYPYPSEGRQNEKHNHRELTKLITWITALSNQSCLILCDPVDCSLPGFSVHGILQARILEWVTFSFSRGSSQPRDTSADVGPLGELLRGPFGLKPLEKLSQSHTFITTLSHHQQVGWPSQAASSHADPSLQTPFLPSSRPCGEQIAPPGCIDLALNTFS